MPDTVLVRPRHGLILDGIPRKGAEIPTALADEWIANQLVERIEPSTPTAPLRPARKPRRANDARKRRSTR